MQTVTFSRGWRRERGFNLIEIAIVLAVIGLVIGGIYIAAAAAIENNRQVQLTKDVLLVAQNVRNAYVNQAAYTEPSHEDIRRMGLYPADMLDNGTDFISPYGDRTHLADGTSTGYPADTFYVSFYSIPQTACIGILTKTFGSAKAAHDAGMLAAGTWPNHFINTAAVTNGITIQDAVTVCDNTSPNSVTPNTNEICFIFTLH